MHKAKFNESLWDNARKNRPSIFNREKSPLDQLSENSSSLSRENFCKLLLHSKLLKEGEMPSMQELHAELSKIYKNCYHPHMLYSLNLGVNEKKEIPINYAYPFSILFLNYLVDISKIKVEEVAKHSVSLLETFDVKRFFLDEHNWHTIDEKINAIFAFIVKNNLVELCLELFDSLSFYFKYYMEFNNGFEFESGFSEKPKFLKKEASESFQKIITHSNEMKPGLFSYPYLGQRFRGVFNKDINSFKFVFLHSLPIPDLSDLSSAVIIMYPWEADHLLKAKEMLKRGIKTAKPRGRIILNDIEYALFEYVHGTRLDHISDAGVWQEFGRIAKKCHEAGIIINDLAGRNAIFTGKEIKLIDFEHTCFYPTAERLSNEDREISISRIKEELEDRDKKLDEAFFKGYNEQ